MASSDSQIDKPQRGGRPKRAEPPDVNINTHKALILRASFKETNRNVDILNNYNKQLAQKQVLI